MLDPITHYSLENNPTVYDEEALTVLQLCARVAAKVNECVREFNTFAQDINKAVEKLFTTELQGHVDKWLNEHPEATTTVRPQSLSLEHFTQADRLHVTNQRVNVTTYGATGDGTTDDTNALNSAGRGSEPLYIPAGIYKITEPVYFSNDVYAHKDAVIHFVPSNTGTAQTAINATGACVRIATSVPCTTVGKTINLDTSGLPSDLKAGDILFLNGTEKASDHGREYETIRDVLKVETVNAGSITFECAPLYYYGSVTIDRFDPVKNIVFDGIKVVYSSPYKQAGSNGIKISYGDNVTIRNCFAEGFDNSQIMLEYCINSRMSGNYAEVNYSDELQYGVLVWGGRNNLVSGNTVNSKRTSIDVTRLATDITITGNTVVGNINTHGSSYITISNNNVSDGSILVRSKSTVVTGNTVENTGATAIDIQEMGIDGGHVISNNIFRGCVAMKAYQSGIIISGNQFFVSDTYHYSNSTGAEYEAVIRIMRGGSADQKKGVTITGNTFEFVPAPGGMGSPLYCIEANANLPTIYNMVVSGNTIRGFQTGLYLGQGSHALGQNLSVKDNVIECTKTGIVFRYTHNTQITGNSVIGTTKGTNGIERLYAEGAVVAIGCVIRDNYLKNFEYGIKFNGNADVQKVVFVDNIADGCDNLSAGISGNSTRINNEIFVASPDKSVWQIKISDDGTVTTTKQSWSM